ncbi:cell wall-binding repeat-containing protein [Herbiconiux sp. P15]|uniref:cell wall-binding repeat-containing protein n=1 Tax=Herbiconiux liukaitaii TaxID=3342799 RepID=UPI0035BA0B5F
MSRSTHARRWCAALVATVLIGSGVQFASAGAASASISPAAVDAPADLAAIAIPSSDDVRGNIHLPTTGASGSTITWSSSDPAVVSDAVVTTEGGEIAPGAVTRGTEDTTVQLTATAEGESRVFDVTVKAAVPAADPEGYMFTYFAGESTDAGEEIYFGASEGSSPLEWDELNGGNPVLSSSFGEEGLRDPMIIRSPEGDKFFIVATDLKIYPNGDFGRAQRTGSLYLEIWESTDLVNWSPQRHVQVSDEATIGNTWAPEAYYDETIGEYVVFWASNIYDASIAPEARDNFATYNRMMYATTRDFVTFSEPQIWSDSNRGRGLGLIDSTVIQDGDTYYRFTKDEGTMNVLLQKSDSLRATSGDPMVVTEDPNAWSLVTREIGRNQTYTAIDGSTRTYTGGEGPTVFKDVQDDGTWWLFIDQPGYHGGVGYVAFRSTDKGLTWQAQDSSGLPGVPRHGTVLPITAAEQERLQEAYNTLEGVAQTEFDVETTPGEAPLLPSTVAATYTSGATGQAEITWDAIDPAAYSAVGSFEVTGRVEGLEATLTARVTVAEAPGLDEGLVVHYELDETTGTVAEDTSGNDRDATVEGTPQWAGAEGFRFTGGTTATGNRIKMPNNLITGLDDVSASFDLWVDAGLPQNTMSFVLGNASTANSGYMFATARDYNNTFRAAITPSSGGAELSAAGPQRLPEGEWVRVTYTVSGGEAGSPGVARLYQNENLVATNANITTTPGAIGGGTTTFNYLGRSSWAADPLFKGQMRDFRLYDRALDTASVRELAGVEEVTDAQRVADDAEALSISGSESVVGSVTLPATGETHGSEITWVSSDPAVVTDTAAAADGTIAAGAVTRPAWGEGDTTVTVTATVRAGEESATRSFTLTVKESPRATPDEGYGFAYFAGEPGGQNTVEGEKIYLAASDGNDALNWNDVNEGQPVLTSTEGTTGLRDPFIIRSVEGDKFYMLATDLSIGSGTSWYDSFTNGSRSLEIWESTDLQNWSEQRHVEVAPENAGMAWAPEAYWDETIGEYVVYWASRMFSDATHNYETSPGAELAQILYSTTRDFETFSEPQVWQEGWDRIDSTVIKEGDTYYRYTKEIGEGTCTDIIAEKSTDLRAPTVRGEEGAWTTVADCVTKENTTPAITNLVEGPTVFKANPGDTSVPEGSTNGHYLFVDDFNGGGYIPLYSDDLDSGEWTQAEGADLPPDANPNAVPRHGTVLNLTRAQWLSLQGSAPERIATSVAVSTSADGQVTATVTAADGHEVAGEVRFTVGDWSTTAAVTAEGDTFVATAALPAGLTGTQTVKADYLGYDTLDASTASAEFEGAPEGIEVDRIAGADRYEVAVNTSKAGFPEGSDTVYVASGEVFPDALSAAPAATVAGAPILLTTAANLPTSVSAEIERLGATDIVIVGGTSTVSTMVEASLATLGTVSRIGGADRFEASRNIAKAAFPRGTETAVLATGTTFSDALAAGAAIDGDGPVILVNGSASRLDAATRTLLQDLGVSDVVIAGGEASVSAGIQADAVRFTSVVRLGGADRFAAARSINDHFFTEADHVLLATGLTFPDALAGSAYAPRIHAPLFTVLSDCVPAETLAQIEELGATKVTLLGGTATLTEAVENLVACP